MAYFKSGVSRYIITEARVTMHFPVDLKGNAWICCEACAYYRHSSRCCGLNGEPVGKEPNKYVGGLCPLKPVHPAELEDET